MSDTQIMHAPKPALNGIWHEWIRESDVKSLVEHPLCRELRSDKAELDSIRIFLTQHQYYSKYFTRYLCALISNVHTSSDVKNLAQNLIEELGEDIPGASTHADLYLRSMKLLAVEPGDMPVLGATHVLSAAMFSHCRNPDPLIGLAALCLGAEAIVPLLYTPIVEGLKRLNQPAEARKFFDIHVEDDEDHAIAMLHIMKRLIAGDADRHAVAVGIGSEMISYRLLFLDAVKQVADTFRRWK